MRKIKKSQTKKILVDTPEQLDVVVGKFSLIGSVNLNFDTVVGHDVFLKLVDSPSGVDSGVAGFGSLSILTNIAEQEVVVNKVVLSVVYFEAESVGIFESLTKSFNLHTSVNTERFARNYFEPFFIK